MSQPPPEPDARFARLRDDVLARIADADAAHDALHVCRVMAHARTIAAAEGADVAVAEMAALLHELVNLPKDHPDSSRSGDLCADAAESLLRERGWDADFAARVAYCIRVHAFSRGLPAETAEARVLQDADRLDAIGAIGIARCFATTGAMRRPLYAGADPFARSDRPLDDKQFAVDHFFRKLLRIEAQLHTATARALAAGRTAFMRAYLEQLEREL